jgi:hypothetical protein
MKFMFLTVYRVTKKDCYERPYTSVWVSVVARQISKRYSRLITPHMLINTWQELEYRLDICRATTGAHTEVYGCASKSFWVTLYTVQNVNITKLLGTKTQACIFNTSSPDTLYYLKYIIRNISVDTMSISRQQDYADYNVLVCKVYCITNNLRPLHAFHMNAVLK